MSAQPSLIVFGEVLFDHFPDGQSRLGGAPFNVAAHLQALGLNPLLLSRVGDDPQAQTIRRRMGQLGLSTAGLQQDSAHPTGMVEVSFVEGEPCYEIVHPAAYDFITPDQFPAILEQGSEPKPEQGLLYHGSLAQRSAGSREALQQLKSSFKGRIFFDVNLRAPWWNSEAVLSEIQTAHWLKLNHHELKALGLGGDDLQAAAKSAIARFDLQGIIITCGEQGALTVSAAGEQAEVVPEPVDDVVDTVGAGDAFTSVMVAGLVNNWPLQETMQRAQRLASRIVGIRGALPESNQLYQSVR